MVIILIIKVYTCIVNNVYLIVIIVMQFAPLPLLHLSAIVELCSHKRGERNLGIIQESELQMKIDFSGKKSVGGNFWLTNTFHECLAERESNP
jgi:hypothetical protein